MIIYNIILYNEYTVLLCLYGNFSTCNIVRSFSVFVPVLFSAEADFDQIRIGKNGELPLAKLRSFLAERRMGRTRLPAMVSYLYLVLFYRYIFS